MEKQFRGTMALLDAKQAGVLLGVHQHTAIRLLTPTKKIKLKTSGQYKYLYSEPQVLTLVKEREVAKKEKAEKKENAKRKYPIPQTPRIGLKKYEKLTIEKPTYRGTICAVKGCCTEIPTGCRVCAKHRAAYKAQQEGYLDDFCYM